MQEHLIREANFYLKTLIDLQKRNMAKKDILEREVFWNHIMEDHAEFIRGGFWIRYGKRTNYIKSNDLAKLI